MDTVPETQFLVAYDQHANALFRFCYAHLGDREKAKDTVQEAYIRTWKYLVGGRKIDQIRPFLYRTARNILIDLSRKPRHESLEILQEAGFDVPDAHGLDPLSLAEARRAVRLIGHLDVLHREALLLRYVDEMMPRDIAALTGESENTISVRIHRGLQKLKDLMGEKNT